MRNALLGGTLVALAAGLIGYFIIVRNSAFAAHALAHIGFPGATGAVLVGLPVSVGLAAFCIGGALVMVESSDVLFAIDSIPAIFAITTDPFIVLTSNVFAILGLRAMYFLLAGVHERFHLLSYGLALVLAFIGIKMLIIDIYKIPVVWSLSFTVLTLTATMLLSLRIPPKGKGGSAYPFAAKSSTIDTSSET